MKTHSSMISIVKYQNKSSHVIPKGLNVHHLKQNKFSSVLLGRARVQFLFSISISKLQKTWIKKRSKLCEISIYMQDLSLAISLMETSANRVMLSDHLHEGETENMWKHAN